ncbi:MAG: DUF2336 domain-containing protein [Sphingosinicella sp.]
MAKAPPGQREGQRDAARQLLAASRERFATAATDLLLSEQVRLTEWQRITASRLLARLVRTVEVNLRTGLAARYSDNDMLHAALTSAQVPIATPILERTQALRDPDLISVLVRRVEEHRFWKSRVEHGREYVVSLVSDADQAIAADAMALVIARSRRFDRFEEPSVGRAELPAELQHRLVWIVAAALRQYLVQQHDLAAVDAVIGEVASALIASYDEGETFDALALKLSRRLQASGRLSGAELNRMLEDGLLPMFLAGLSLLNRLDLAAAWEILADPRGRGPALLLRAAALSREEAAILLISLNARGPLFSGAEGETAAAQLELFDAIDIDGAREVLRLWQFHPAYRASVARMSTRTRGVASEAA